MTDQHTIESTTEYTLDEQIAALRKLGAIMSEEGYDTYYVYFDDCSIYNSTRKSAFEAAHEFLRTDESAWMKMDALFGESKLEQEEFDEHTEFHYEARGYKSYANLTRQEAVYDCYMQFIREELKKK